MLKSRFADVSSVMWQLPVPDRAVGKKLPLRKFLLERVPLDGGLIDINAQSGFDRGCNRAGLFTHGVMILHHLVAPWHIVADGFADDVVWLRKAKLQ